MPDKIKRVAYACFRCRKTFKRPFDNTRNARTCPACGGVERYMGIRFRSPDQEDLKAWQIIELLVLSDTWHRFEGNGKKAAFPKTTGEARAFIASTAAFEDKRRISGADIDKAKNKKVRKTSRRIGKKLRS